MSSEVDDGVFPNMLRSYYKRLFPVESICLWLSNGDRDLLSTREFSFTLTGDVYLRYLSYTSFSTFHAAIIRHNPIKIDIGAIYTSEPIKKLISGEFVAKLKEVVIDIDLTDYDSIRTCCSGAEICTKCWKFMVIAAKIIDRSLKEDFGFYDVLWVFSGRRGIHCWVSDASAKQLENIHRNALVDYFNIFKVSDSPKEVFLPDKIYTPIRKAYDIVKIYFVDAIVKDQDILGTEERFNKFLNIIDASLREKFREKMYPINSSVGRWDEFVKTFDDLQQKGSIPKHLKNLKQEITLQYAYPRLDINVTKSRIHLLKSPFCVHPKTGKVCVPFSIKHIDNFDPTNVPTVSSLLEEIDNYDKKTKAQEVNIGVEEKEFEKPTKSNLIPHIKDFKKTSLLKYMNFFNEFLRDMKKISENNPCITDF